MTTSDVEPQYEYLVIEDGTAVGVGTFDQCAEYVRNRMEEDANDDALTNPSRFNIRRVRRLGT